MDDTENAPEDSEPADAFAALGNSTRVEILRAFLEHALERPADPVVSFSTLRKTAGVRDSGRFRYHLEQLRGTFVEKCDGDDGNGGYRLTYAGSEVINAIVAGTYTDRERLGPAALDSDCERCGATARASYRDGVLEVTCEDGHPLFVWTLPPNAADGASLEELVALATTLAFQSHELVADGTCSECYSPIEPGIRAVDDEAGQSARFTARCEACGATWDAPVGFVLLTHPEIERLYHRQGRPVRTRYWWDLEVVGETAQVTQIETDPLCVRLTVTIAETRVRAIVDESGRVSELEREPIRD